MRICLFLRLVFFEALRSIGDAVAEAAIVIAASSMSSIPALIVYVIFRLRITKSLMLTGMGGR